MTGNNISDIKDVIIAYNNSVNFVSILKPGDASRKRRNEKKEL